MRDSTELARAPHRADAEPAGGSPAQVTPTSRRRGIRVAGRWYYVVTIATAGLFAWVPFVHGARRLSTSRARRLALIYVGVDALLYVLVAITPQSANGQTVGAAGNAISTIGGLLALGVTIVGCLQLSSLRRMVYEGAPVGKAEEPPLDPAIKAVLAARARRDEARRLAADDPLLARELHIGRPDLGADYDDGGLIDLNSAPTELIAEVCGIPNEVAATIADARTHRDEPFANVDELLVMAELPVTTWDRIRDRAVLIP